MEQYSQFLQKLKQGNLEEIRQMIAQIPEFVNYQDEGSKRTPIFTVASCYEDTQAIQILQILINSGANLQHEDVNKRTIAFILCSRGMVNCLMMLKSKDEQILTHKDRLGQTPLFAAVRENQLNLIKNLNLTPDLINMTDEIAGQTILFYAAACGHEDLCRHLIKRGADLLITDLCGQYILSYTQKMPRLHLKIKNRIRKLQKQRENQQPEQVQDNEHIVGKQAYQMLVISQDNRIKRITRQQFNKIRQELEQVDRSIPNKNYSYLDCEKVSITQYNQQYLQNWRHLAIKIVSSCMRLRGGKYFQNFLKAYQHLSEVQLKKLTKLDLIDINAIKTKLEHNIYQNVEQFAIDMAKIWQNCQKINHRYTLMYKYAQELRKHVYQLMVQHNFFTKY